MSFASAPRALGRLRGLDGLRAIAVAAVVAYHLDGDALPGGFLGVEVFFVISGYLITALLVQEWDEHRSISLPTFWGRRARRLLPALFAMLLVTLAVATLAFPSEVARLRTDAAAATVYVTNWYLVFGQQPYFETVGRQSPLLHLWSLAIEEQFYLVWPILLGAALFVAGRRAAFVLVVVGIVASAAATVALYTPGDDPSRVYYGTDTRAAGLLFGALLALVFVPRPSVFDPEPSGLRRALADVAGVGALVGVLAAFALVDETQPLLFGGGMLALDVAVVVLIAAVVGAAGRWLPAVLESAPFRWLGSRSYAVYLWHWPVFEFTRPGLDVPVDGPANVGLRLVLTIGFAELSYRLVERPIREGALNRAWEAWRARPFGVRRILDPRLGAAFGSLAVVSLLLADVVTASPPPAPAEVPVTALEGLVTPPPDDGSDVVTADGGEGRPVSVQEGSTPRGAGGTAKGSGDAKTRSGSGGGGTKGSADPTFVPHLHRVPVARPVLGLGESVLIAAAPSLARVVGPLDVDAEVGRHVTEDVDALRKHAAKGDLGQTVILNIGNNGPIFQRDLDDAMDILRDVPVVVWINVSVPRDWQDRNNRLIAAVAAKYPNVRLVDWHAASSGKSSLFAPDDVHPNIDGAKVLAGLVENALEN